MINKLKKTMIGTTVLLLIIISGLLFGIVKGYQNWRELQGQVEKAQIQLNALEDQLNDLTLLRKQGELLQAYLQNINEVLPQEIREQELAAIVGEAAFDAGGQILELGFQETTVKTEYRELPFRVIFEGEYQGLIQFLKSLEEHPRIFRINEIAMHSDKESILIRADLAIVTAFSGS